MKAIGLKALVILPIIAFVDYAIMILVGCTGNMFGYGNTFYECTFCTIGKVVLLVSLLTFLVVISLDVISHLRQRNQVC